MTDESARQTVLFPDLFDKPLKAAFDQPHASSDGGAVLLKATDRRLGLTSAVAATMVDRRDPVKVRHSVQDLMAQRVFGIACGYSDANDADALAEDPMQKLLLDRDPVNGERLASQPTLSRFENRATPRTLFRMAEALTDTVLRHHRRRLHGRVRRITVDLDVTDDPTHGAQQLTFFNGHYDSWCYLPLLAFVRRRAGAVPRCRAVATGQCRCDGGSPRPAQALAAAVVASLSEGIDTRSLGRWFRKPVGLRHSRNGWAPSTSWPWAKTRY